MAELSLKRGGPRHSIDQVRLTGAADRLDSADVPHWPLMLDRIFGALPGPCDTASVVRVQVPLALLYETMVVLVIPAGELPNEATKGTASTAGALDAMVWA